MAPRLYGRHFSIHCVDCGYEFKVDTKIPKRNTFACPNCGFTENKAPGFVSEPDQVLIELDSKASLQRFDLAAIKRDDNYNVVKRVIGFPGEKIEIKNGDLVVDSKLIQKEFAIQRSVRIPVHDSRYRPNIEMPRRWRPADKSSGWSFENNIFSFQPNPAQDPNDFDWLTYHHWRGFHHRANRTDDFPIEDNYAFNQAINRSLVAMRDLFLEVQLGSPITGALAIRVNRDADVFELRFLADQTGMILMGPGFARTEVELAVATQDVRKIEVTTFDSCLRVSVNGSETGCWELPSIDFDVDTVKHSFRIGARDRAVTVSHFRIFRDIYYRNLIDSPQHGFQLGTNEFFLLGDNVPVSIDSRNWKTAGENQFEILGPVTAADNATKTR